MAEEWQGRRDVALLREPHAVNTAENAVRSLELVRAIEGASEVVLVCSIRHFPRVRFFFGGLYRRYGYRTRYRYVVRPLPVAAARAPRAVVDRADGAGSAPRAAPAGRGRSGLRAGADLHGVVCLAWRATTTRLRWACCSIPAAGRRSSPRTCRARSIARGLACDAGVRVARARGRARQRGDVLRRHRHGAGRLRRCGGALGARRGPDGCAVPDAPLLRGAGGRPRPVVPASVARAGRADGRGVGEIDRRIRRTCGARRSSTCTTSRRSTRPPPRSCRASRS